MSPVGHWRIVPWFSARSSWGVDLRLREPRSHSQLRVHLGRRHLTLQKVWEGRRSA